MEKAEAELLGMLQIALLASYMKASEMQVGSANFKELLLKNNPWRKQFKYQVFAC